MPEPVHPDIEYVYGFSGYEVNALLEQYQNYRLGFIHLEAMSADMENYLKEAAPKAEFVDIAPCPGCSERCKESGGNGIDQECSLYP